jgi:hypothetical protein
MDIHVTMDKYNTIKSTIGNLRVKDIRHMFMLMRKTDGIDANYLFPRYGFTCGEFTTGYVLNMPHRTSSSG